MKKRLRDYKGEWIGVTGLIIAAIIGLWKTNELPQGGEASPKTEVSAGTARDITTITNSTVVYNSGTDKTSPTNLIQTPAAPVEQPSRQAPKPKTFDNEFAAPSLNDTGSPQRSRNTSGESGASKSAFHIYGFSQDDGAILLSTLKRLNAVSGHLSLKDAARTGGQNVSIKVLYEDGFTYEDSFGVPTDNVAAVISNQLSKHSRRVEN